VLSDLVIVCKIDAIFKTETGYEIVDWKSGLSPKNGKDLAERAIQLALYRIALSEWKAIPLERISASFFFAKDGVEIWPEKLPSRTELVELIEDARTARRELSR